MDMIGDIVEKEVSIENIVPPRPPVPERQQPAKKASRWKQQRDRESRRKPAPQTRVSDPSKPLSASEQIHLENVQRLASMSTEEYEAEREELLGSMDPKVLQALLKRAEARANDGLDSTDVDSALGVSSNVSADQAQDEEDELHPAAGAAAAASASSDGGTESQGHDDSADAESVGVKQEHEHEHDEQHSSVHFTTHKAVGDLDVADPEFNEKLHAKYFPTLDVEPDKLAWMAPVSDQETASSYNPEDSTIAASELRFDFQGNLISPRQSANVDSYLGLHHHGDAPHAAGYTVGELGHLSRSSVASQRCIAIQTLGRILYKLGKRNVYGKEISEELLKVVEFARVIDSLHEGADENYTKSLNVRSYATEALWLWRQGGAVRKA